MEEVVGKILFYDVALIATAHNEVVDAVVGISLQDVPQDRLATDVDHRFGAGRGFFGDAGTKAAREDHEFHKKRGGIPPLRNNDQSKDQMKLTALKPAPAPKRTTEPVPNVVASCVVPLASK